MKAYLIYKVSGPDQSWVDNFARAVGKHRFAKIDLVDKDSPQASGLIKLYAVVDYPALIVTMDNGQLIEIYQSEWPLMATIKYQLSQL